MSEQHEQNQVGDSWLNTAVIKLDIIEGPGETSTCLVTFLTPPPLISYPSAPNGAGADVTGQWVGLASTIRHGPIGSNDESDDW